MFCHPPQVNDKLFHVNLRAHLSRPWEAYEGLLDDARGRTVEAFLSLGLREGGTGCLLLGWELILFAVPDVVNEGVLVGLDVNVRFCDRLSRVLWWWRRSSWEAVDEVVAMAGCKLEVFVVAFPIVTSKLSIGHATFPEVGERRSRLRSIRRCFFFRSSVLAKEEGRE